jgi:hypothetical protein
MQPIEDRLGTLRQLEQQVRLVKHLLELSKMPLIDLLFRAGAQTVRNLASLPMGQDEDGSARGGRPDTLMCERAGQSKNLAEISYSKCPEYVTEHVGVLAFKPKLMLGLGCPAGRVGVARLGDTMGAVV